MGNCIAERQPSYQLTFNKMEEHLLNKSFDIYCDIFPQYVLKWINDGQNSEAHFIVAEEFRGDFP